MKSKSCQTSKPNLLQTCRDLLWTSGASQCIFWKWRGRVPILSCFTQSRTEWDPVTGLYPLSVLHLVSIATINTTTLLSVKLKLNKWTQTRKKQIKIRYKNLNKRFNFYLQFQCSFTENQFSFTQQRKHNWRNGHNIHTACKSKCIKWLGELSHKLKS